MHTGPGDGDLDVCSLAIKMQFRGKDLLTNEAPAKLNKTVTSAKAEVQNVLKRLDSCFRRNDGEGLLQEALITSDFFSPEEEMIAERASEDHQRVSSRVPEGRLIVAG